MNREPTPHDEDLLSAYLDGECTDDERAWVEVRLAESEDLRAELDAVRVARDAIRSLPPRDAPPEFWARLLADDEPVTRAPDAPSGIVGAPTALDTHRDLPRDARRPRRWVTAVAAAAVAAVVAAVVLVPRPESVDPPVATFTDAHAVRSSLQDDAVTALAPVAVSAGFRR